MKQFAWATESNRTSKRSMMRFRLLAIPIGAILFLMGLIWFLQGNGILPGSFMTGSAFWAGAGALTAIVGLILIVTGVTERKTSSEE